MPRLVPDYAQVVLDVCSTPAEIDSDVPVVRVWRPDEGGKPLEMTAKILKAAARPIAREIGIRCEHKVALRITVEANRVSAVQVLS